MKDLTDFYGEKNIVMKLFCCELKTRFYSDSDEHKQLIYKLFPHNEKFEGPKKLYQCVL